MKIIIEGTPIPKDRHMCGCTKENKPFVYDPQIKKKMNAVKKEILRQWNAAFESDQRVISIEASNLTKARSFDVDLVFLFMPPRSSSLGTKNRAYWGLSDYNQKPDCDNLEKFYLDCMTGILWDDDSQVVNLSSRKEYSEKPRTEITIMAKREMKLHSKAQSILEIFGPQKLKEFCKDAATFQFPEMIYENDQSIDRDIKTHFLASASCMLSEFAEKYADDLKKVQKYKGLLKDMIEDREIINAIEGRYVKD